VRGGTRRATKIRTALAAMVAVLCAACEPGIFTFGNDNARTGAYSDQANLTPSLVGGGTFGLMFSASVDGQVYAQPLVANDTVFVATENNNIYGVDRTTGAIKWSRNLGVAWQSADVGCGDVSPNVGVTGTPVIDSATNTAYFFSKTYASGTSGPGAYFAHAVDIDTGAERAGWPVLIQGSATNQSSTTFNPTDALQRTGLLLLDGVIYAGFGGLCDHQPFDGWVVGVSTAGVVKTMWASAPATPGEAGIWQAGDGIVSDGSGSMFVATGNGSSNVTARPGSQPGNSLGESVVHLRVQADASLQATDFFSPYDADTLDRWDGDLGSGGPVLLPPTPFSTPAHPRLMVVAGKAGYLYLLDANNLGGMKQGAGGGDNVVGRFGPFGGVWGKVGVWSGDGGYIYLLPPGSAIGDGVIRVLKWGLDANGQPTLVQVGRSNESTGFASTAGVVSSNGTNSGTALLWEVARTTAGTSQLRTYDAVPVSGHLVLRWSTSIGTASKFSLPAVFGTRVYLGTQDGKLLSFGSPVTDPLTGGPLTIAHTPVGNATTATLTLRANSDMSITAINATDPQFTIGTPTTNTTPPQSTYPLQLTAGTTVTIPVTFTPTAPGAATANLNVETSIREVQVPVSSFGVNPTGELESDPAIISFGGVATGYPPVTDAVDIANVGASGVTVNSVTLPSAPFTVTGLPAPGSVIPALSDVSATATFSPGALGDYSSVLTLQTSAGELDIPMSGTSAPPPALSFDTTSLDFGTQAVGSTTTLSFMVENTGGSALTITKSKPPAANVGFAATTSLPEDTTLAPGDALTETVSFTPTSTASVADGWTITADDGSGAHTITFTGAGS
jgi:hypothetical protein